jgi:hypothetical protein
MVYPWKGPLCYSLIKHIATSPAEFRHRCETRFEPTASMRLGTLVHWYLLGGPLAREPFVCPHDGTRASKAFKAWEVELPTGGVETYTAAEGEEARRIAIAVRTAPHNRKLWQDWIEGGEYETPVTWSYGGFDWSTRGIDIIHRERGFPVDFKTTRSVNRHALQRQSDQLHYGEQLAIYSTAAESIGVTGRGAAVFAACTAPPHVCSVRTLTVEDLDTGRRNVDEWLSTLRWCLDRDEWPGPEPEPVPLDIRDEIVGESELDSEY